MGQLNKPVTEEISNIYLSTMPQVVYSVHNAPRSQNPSGSTTRGSWGSKDKVNVPQLWRSKLGRWQPWDTTLFLPARTCLTYRKKAREFQAALMTKELYHILFHSYFPILANCLHWKYRERKRKIRQPTVPVLASPYLLIGKRKVQSFGRICVN